MVDTNKLRCANPGCDKLLFDYKKFLKDIKEFGKDGTTLLASLIASHGNPVAFPAVLIQFDNMNEKITRDEYVKGNISEFIDDGDKAFCSQECYDEYYMNQ